MKKIRRLKSAEPVAKRLRREFTAEQRKRIAHFLWCGRIGTEGRRGCYREAMHYAIDDAEDAELVLTYIEWVDQEAYDEIIDPSALGEDLWSLGVIEDDAYEPKTPPWSRRFYSSGGWE